MTETYTTEDFVLALNGAKVTAYSTGSGTYTYTSAPARGQEFERFEDLASKLFAVPKTEISEAERQS